MNAAVLDTKMTLPSTAHYPPGRTYFSANKSVHLLTPGPANVWVCVDEHPDSINDSIFHVAPGFPASDYQWRDLPASYHNGACGFSFADGHSEIKKWRDDRTKLPVRMETKWWSPNGAPYIVRGSDDYAWIVERMPFTR